MDTNKNRKKQTEKMIKTNKEQNTRNMDVQTHTEIP